MIHLLSVPTSVAAAERVAHAARFAEIDAPVQHEVEHAKNGQARMAFLGPTPWVQTTRHQIAGLHAVTHYATAETGV